LGATFNLWHLIGHLFLQKLDFIHENIYRNDSLGHFAGALLARCPNYIIALPADLVGFIAFSFTWFWCYPYPIDDIRFIYVALFTFAQITSLYWKEASQGR